jgi:hypothetical protein
MVMVYLQLLKKAWVQILLHQMIQLYSPNLSVFATLNETTIVSSFATLQISTTLLSSLNVSFTNFDNVTNINGSLYMYLV